MRDKTEQTVALGYSSCGRVLEVGAEVNDLRPGDLVACAGQNYAFHAELVVVPRPARSSRSKRFSNERKKQPWQ